MKCTDVYLSACATDDNDRSNVDHYAYLIRSTNRNGTLDPTTAIRQPCHYLV
ncbi:MAG: hypothetical protein ABL921_10140 [Pirellula sp.]